jgi:hypothetical protein
MSLRDGKPEPAFGPLDDEDCTRKVAGNVGIHYIYNNQVSTRIPVRFGEMANPIKEAHVFEVGEWVMIVNENGEEEPVQIVGWEVEPEAEADTKAVAVGDDGEVRYLYVEEMKKID